MESYAAISRLAINLLDLQDIKEVMGQISQIFCLDDQPLKENSAYAAGLFQEMAGEKGLKLKLRKKGR